MNVPGELSRKFLLVQPYVTDVHARVKDILSAFAENHGFPFTGRVKTLPSLTEKLESGRYDKWGNVDDLSGFAIVIPTLENEQEVLEFLEDRFECVELRKRGSSLKDPNVFRFDATRFIGTLRADERLSDDSPLCRVKFEVQVRSAFEHAWSAATHELVYKPERVDWKRLRLAAQLKASVEQLDQVIVGFDSVAELVAAHEWPEIEAQKSIELQFREFFDNNMLPAEMRPARWGRFCGNVYQLILATDSRFVPPRRILEFVRRHLSLIKNGLSRIPRNQIPHGISALQLCVGLLAEGGAIKSSLYRFIPVVSEDLLLVFPSTAKLQPVFDFEL